MTLKLTGLRELYADMRTKGIKRYKFGFTYNSVSFDIFFLLMKPPLN